MNCPACKRDDAIVSVEVQGVYDGVLFRHCGGCGVAWHCWPVGTWQHDAAVVYVDHLNAGASRESRTDEVLTHP